MSKKDKQIERLKANPKDYTFAELRRLLLSFGYHEIGTGKTSGSRSAFMNDETSHIIRIHRPHPSPILKRYQIDFIITELQNQGLIP